MKRWLAFAAWAILAAAHGRAQEQPSFQQPKFTIPAGYTVELAAGPPLVLHPVMAGLDDRGRLFVAENAGVNLQRTLLEEQLPNSILRLEDTDGDGKFDKRTVFADKLTFPQGALWHDGWLYAAVSGAIWRFQDKDDDGVAETREKIVSSFGYTGNAADVHGCFLGPEGRIYWCEGRHGHDITDAAGNSISKGKAARIFSCRPNGSDVRTHCGGGMDNPVEIDWTADGEMLGTVNILYGQRGDCLVHWMHGGVYPRADQQAVLAEFRRTGDLLGPVHDYGHVAVSGCCRVRLPLRLGEGRREGAAAVLPEPLGTGFGVGGRAPRRDDPLPKLLKGEGTKPAATFLVTEFNTHKVKRTDLFRDGATFRAETSDFLQAASDDFHPTDVLEDADGSFLIVDTGGWFRIGCPTSRVAKPNVLGAIYRVRRTDAKLDDPRGLMLHNANEYDPFRVIPWLGDTRPAVRQQAMDELVRHAAVALPVLSRAIVHKQPLVRQNAIWTLARIGTPQATGTIRLLGLTDSDPVVVSAAAYSVGALRDTAATGNLCELLQAAETLPPVLRSAATALGQIGDKSAVPALLSALRRGGDRVLEHALIYALIEIHDRDATARGLSSDDTRVRRAALIALDQMPNGHLTHDEVAALLDTGDDLLLAAALDVLARHPTWIDELLALATRLLAQPALSETEQSLLSGALVGLARDERVQTLVATTLGRQSPATPHRALLLDVIGRSELSPLPAAWAAALVQSLAAEGDAQLRPAIAAARSADDQRTTAPLLAIARDNNRTIDTRLAALSASRPEPRSLVALDVQLLLDAVAAESPLTRLAAARLWADVPLSGDQFQGLSAAQRVRLEAAGKELEVLLNPPRNTPSIEDQRLLQAALNRMDEGDAMAGRQVFVSRKASCSACHRVGKEGGKIGPDLSKVGERRTPRDLLEAVLLPSSSIARGFESHAIRTKDGQTLTGLIVRETAESVFLRTLDQRELRVSRREIDEQKTSSTSIMPAGLDRTLSPQELADLLAYLQSLR